MPNDYRYDAGDRVLDVSGNYATTPGQADAMLREMASETAEIDGVEYGNRAYALVDRGQDTPENREEIKRYFEEVGERYVAAGAIRDLEVTVDNVTGYDGVGVYVVCFDVMRGQTVSTALPFVDPS